MILGKLMFQGHIIPQMLPQCSALVLFGDHISEVVTHNKSLINVGIMHTYFELIE